MPSPTPKRKPVLADLGLQGGGAHGAFTWGVLDRLLEEPWLTYDGVSGTSAGASPLLLASPLMLTCSVTFSGTMPAGRCAERRSATFSRSTHTFYLGVETLEEYATGANGKERFGFDVLSGIVGYLISNFISCKKDRYYISSRTGHQAKEMEMDMPYIKKTHQFHLVTSFAM